MTPTRITGALLVSALLSSCGDSTGPGAGPSAKVSDPSGDTYGSDSVKWDVTAMTISRDTSAVTVRLDFSSNPISPVSGDSNAMLGFVEFDTDQDSTTGFLTAVDQFRPAPGSTGMGAEYRLDLATYAPDSTTLVLDTLGTPTGSVRPVFHGKSVTIRIPLALLGGATALNAAAIVGTRASPSDIIPENGHLHLGPSALAGSSSAGAARAESGRRPMPPAPPRW